ncbi:MAG: LamG domain-containing protein, partial [Flavobacteriales bacterium]
MKKLFLCLLTLASVHAVAQDTTWVQTFTFDTISTRRANFQFPATLDTQRFEKVLMYYKLKCSPLTTWDQYNCGEWDYLTYTRVFDHTGQLDSVALNGQMYLANCAAPAQIQLKPFPYTESDLYQVQELGRQAIAVNYYPINAGNQVSGLPFQTNHKGSKFQFVITAAELLAAGMQAGPISSLKLNLAAVGELWQPRIQIAAVNYTTPLSFYEGAFTEVYQSSRIGAGQLQPGWNDFVFYQDFNWDGTSNLLIDFSFAHDLEAAQGLTFLMEPSTAQPALAYPEKNGALTFDGTNYCISSLADQQIGGQFTIEFWAKGNGNAGQNSTFIEALDTANRRILNIHLPWSNNNIYFDAGDETGYDRINQAATPAELDNTWTHWAFVKDQANGQMFIYKNGQLWLSGSNKTREMGYIHRMVLGFSSNQNLGWKGNIDELRVYQAALSQTTIAAHFQNQ